MQDANLQQENDQKTYDTKESGPKRKGKGKIIAIIIVIILVLLIALRIIVSSMGEESFVGDDSVSVNIQTVEIMDLSNTSPLTGRIEAEDSVAVFPGMPGTVTSVNVELGDKVSKGQSLFSVDATQMQTVYNQASQNYNNNKNNLDNMATLLAEGAISQQAYDSVKLQTDSSYESLVNASDALSKCRSSAPISGYVTSVSITQGGMASQASPAVTISNIDKVVVETSVAENLINTIKVGDVVNVLVKSVSDTPIQGTISALSPAPAMGSLTYPIKISINNPDILIKPGMFAEVIITSNEVNNVVAVPSSAVMVKSGNTVVATVVDNKAVLNTVTLGLDNGEYVEIISGLKVGDQIVTYGQTYLEEGTEVVITTEDEFKQNVVNGSDDNDDDNTEE